MMRLTAVFTRIAIPVGKCPSCKADIRDWHTEWLDTSDQGKVWKGQAAIDCPACGAWVLIPKQVVGGVAPEGTEKVKRVWAQAVKWANQNPISPIDLDQYLNGVGQVYRGYFDDQSNSTST